MGGLAEFALKKVAGKAIKLVGIPELGWAMLGAEVIDKVVSEHEKSVCEMARKTLACTHLEVCPKGLGTRISDIVETAFTKRGCAFYYSGVALWHFQADLDVTPLGNVRPIRYSKADGKVGYYNVPTRPCQSCAS